MGDIVVYEVANIDELEKRLAELRTQNPNMQKQLNKIVAYVIREARKRLSKDARAELPNDPRDAYKAVRHAVYKRLLGGQVNILSRRKANNKMSIYEPPKKLRQGQRGGNRIPRSARTQNLMGYYGSDRGFVLRFMNAGTTSRTSRYGNRGAISARDWFGPKSQQAMEAAAENLSQLIERAIDEIWTQS